ncbi:hypothetical protein EYZ11_004438 [Aspergillus tanneri]|uniref:Tf2-1-like SH3-like domain-containing protein n=1 Tax=Aspergillus tanneri TaxID=1220188 RepID=A0A4S3JKZ4_9EURO|nr:hypothetical protein EYZ11_004438 [Aspergillus tanneri]
MSPFMIERGYEPRMSFDWDTPTAPRDHPIKRGEARALVQRKEEVWNFAQEEIEAAQRYWNLGQPSRKLSDQWADPYRILARIGHAYRLELPSSIKVHHIFPPDKLRHAPTVPPLPGQITDPSLLIEVDGHQEWEVETILAS